MAEIANQQGNAFYKNESYPKAQESYRKAMRLDEKEPKYSSNLSAVQYEAGKYPEAIKSIRLSWTLLQAKNRDGESTTTSSADPLAIKLATRFANANSHGFYKKSVPLHPSQTSPEQRQIDIDIENFVDLERSGEKDVKVNDMKAAWQQWRTIRDNDKYKNVKEYQKEVAAGQARLRSTPIFKSASEPTLEYFTFGHDDVMSLMDGINGSDDYSLDSPEYVNQVKWSFLFGGSGDARHVFGTIVHLANMADGLGTRKPTDVLNAHMTLIDVHPASLARVILVMSLLHQILQARLSKDDHRLLQLYATLFYLYNTMLMPDYCHQIVMTTAKVLVEELPQKNHSLSRCLVINEESLPAIINVLKYWSTPLQKSTEMVMRTSLSSEGDRDDFIDHMTSVMNISASRASPEAVLKAMSSKNRASGGDMYGDSEAERSLNQHTMAMLPPKPLLSRHPALAKLVQSYRLASDHLYAAVRTEVERTWKPNPTIFDNSSTEHPDFYEVSGYPEASVGAYDSIKPFMRFVRQFQKRKPAAFCSGATGFAFTTQFFELVADAMWIMQNTLKVEVVVSDVISGTARLLKGDIGSRPKHFPKKYSRIWLSNVPDYTHGLINNAVHLMPYLEPKGLMMSNCLLNTGNWGTIADYCYNYTLLRPEDVPRILGCQVLKPHGTLLEDIAIQQINLPLSLENPPPYKIELPNNLGAFVHVLVHLERVGFPPHWIGNFLQSIIRDNVVSDVEPYVGQLPIPISECYKRKTSHKLHLAPWQADFQTILASVKEALPFSISLPPDYPSAADIHIYKAEVDVVNLYHDPRSFAWGGLVSPSCRAIGIIFYKPTKTQSINQLMEKIPQILEGHPEFSNVDAQIMLSQEYVDLGEGVVSWKMSQDWYEKMRDENWSMVLYRTDLKALVTKPLGAKYWRAVLLVK